MKLKFLRRNIGAILIEFAFAVPVFLVLIYYVHDLPRTKLIQRKMQFVAYESASILQNIAKQKGAALNISNFVETACLSYLTIFPANTLFCVTTHRAPLGYLPFMGIYYVKQEQNNFIQWQYGCRLSQSPIANNVSNISRATDHAYVSQSLVKTFAKDSPPSDSTEIHPALSITDGEVKVLVECTLFYYSQWQFSSGIPNSTVPPRKAFNFLFLSPKRYGSVYGNEQACFFPAVAIFSPFSGAFGEQAPKQ